MVSTTDFKEQKSVVFAEDSFCYTGTYIHAPVLIVSVENFLNTLGLRNVFSTIRQGVGL
jgi:hypothetical protein